MYEFISKPLCEVDVHDNHVTENEAQSVESNKKKHKSTTFNCWKFFTRIGVCDDWKERAIGGEKYTSHLKFHIERYNEIKYEDVCQMILEMQE